MEIDKIIKESKEKRRKEIEIAEKLLNEWQDTKFWISIMELQFKTYLQTEYVKLI